MKVTDLTVKLPKPEEGPTNAFLIRATLVHARTEEEFQERDGVFCSVVKHYADTKEDAITLLNKLRYGHEQEITLMNLDLVGENTAEMAATLLIDPSVYKLFLRDVGVCFIDIAGQRQQVMTNVEAETIEVGHICSPSCAHSNPVGFKIRGEVESIQMDAYGHGINLSSVLHPGSLTKLTNDARYPEITLGAFCADAAIAYGGFFDMAYNEDTNKVEWEVEYFFQDNVTFRNDPVLSFIDENGSLYGVGTFTEEVRESTKGQITNGLGKGFEEVPFVTDADGTRYYIKFGPQSDLKIEITYD